MTRQSRPALLAIVLLASLAGHASAQAVTVSTVGDVLRVHAPGVGFLKGDPLAQLKDGRSVRVELTLAVLNAAGGSRVAQDRQTFALSYDLWEERFAATQPGTPPRGTSHLAAPAIESWCVEQLGIPVRALAAVRPGAFWIRLEYRILDGVTDEDAGAGFTLQGLIEALSRRRRTEASAHAIEAGPFRLQQ